MRVGLIGCGRWGSEIRRVLEELGCDTVVYDPAHPETVGTANQIVRMADRVVVATPPQDQAEMVDRCLEWETPFFCEKPFTLNPVDAAFLRMSARMTNTQGAAGYIAVHASGYPDAAGKFTVRRETDSAGYHQIPAVWDIGIHDIAVYVDLFGRPDHVDYDGDFNSYQVRLTNHKGVADLQGTRTGGKTWEFLFDGEPWSPYQSTVEPLRAELEWWLDGGDNLDDAVTTVETAWRCVS